MEKGIEIPEIRLQHRRVEEVTPEPWIHEIDGKPPYDASYVAEGPAQQQPFKEDSSRVRFMAMLIRKAAWMKGQGMVSATVAKQQAIDKLKTPRSRMPKLYKKEEVFEKELTDILPLGARPGLLEDHQEELENIAETEIFEEQRPRKSDLLINSSHHAVVGDLRPMDTDGGVLQSDRYPGDNSLVFDETRYSGDRHHLCLLNSLGWIDLKNFRGKKIVILSESTMNPLVAHVCMPGSTIQQRAALMKMIQRKTLQVNPLIILFGVTDHLDIGGHLKKLLQPLVAAVDIGAAVLSLYRATMTARTELKDHWQRTIVVTGPGYKEMPLGIQKVLAGMSLTYRATEFVIMGGTTPVDASLRSRRMDTASVFSELSKTVMSMPLLEGAELTLDDALLREGARGIFEVDPSCRRWWCQGESQSHRHAHDRDIDADERQ